MTTRRTPAKPAETLFARIARTATFRTSAVVAVATLVVCLAMWAASSIVGSTLGASPVLPVEKLELPPGQESRFQVVLVGNFQGAGDTAVRRIYVLIDRLTADAYILAPGIGIAPLNLIPRGTTTVPGITTPPSKTPVIPFLPPDSK